MKTAIATALVVFSLLATTAAQASSAYSGYPDWARQAFEDAQN